MIGHSFRMATLGAGVIMALTTLTGTASAAGQNYTTNVIGPIASQSDCAAQAASENDPPQDWTSVCRFETDFPGTSIPDPGWYYNLHILITP